MNKKKVTFADIAKYTNFSKTTISRYFNNPDSLTVENQEKIAKALKNLGYHENKPLNIFLLYHLIYLLEIIIKKQNKNI